MNETAKPAIRIGIDFGSTTCRVAYVHPDQRNAIVPVPLPLDKFLPCFPIAERLPINDPYVSRFFPGITQRLRPDFQLTLGGKLQGTCDIVAQLVHEAIVEARKFSGRPVQSVLVCHPIAADPGARSALRQAIRKSGFEGGLCSDAEAASAWHRVNGTHGDEHANVLVVSAGYTSLGVAVVRITPKVGRVLAKRGVQGVLAGNVIDFAIMQAAVQQLRRRAIAVEDSNQLLGRWSLLRHQAETAKRAIKDDATARFEVPTSLLPGRSEPVKLRLVGSAFRHLVDQHLERVMDVVHGALEEAALRSDEINAVLMMGGSMHLPGVNRMLAAKFSGARVEHLPPEAAASGAALLASEDPIEARGEDGSAAEEGDFLPSLEVFPDLVEVEETGATPAPSAATQQPPAAPPRPNSAAVAVVRICELVEGGEFDAAPEELRRLSLLIKSRLEQLNAGGSPATTNLGTAMR